MRNLSKADDARRDSEVADVKAAAQTVWTAIDEVNALIDQVNTLIDEKVAPAMAAYNEQLDTTRGFVEDLTSQMDEYIGERSDKWQEGDAGQQYQEWKSGFEQIDFSSVEDIAHIEKIEYPEPGLDECAIELEELATSPDA